MGGWGAGGMVVCRILADGRQMHGAAAALEGLGHHNQGKRFKKASTLFSMGVFLDRCYSDVMSNFLRQQI